MIIRLREETELKNVETGESCKIGVGNRSLIKIGFLRSGFEFLGGFNGRLKG